MRRLGPWAIAVALLGCPSGKTVEDAGVPDAGPKVLAEQEPNDRPEQAPVISGSTLVTAHLSADPSRPDEDWYALSSATPKSVDVQVTGIPGGDVTLQVLDVDRNPLALVNSEGEGKPERLPNLGLAGRVFVKVAGAKKGAGGAYTVTFLFKEPAAGFEVEPNDRAVDASPLTLGETLSGFVGHAADEDWYRVELPPMAEAPPATPPPAPAAPEEEQGEGIWEKPQEPAAPPQPTATPDASVEGPKVALKIDLAPVPGVRFELSLLSEAEAPLFQIKSKDGEGLSLRNVGVRATDKLVYLVVKSAWTGAGKEARRTFSAEESYSLSVAVEEAGANAEYEPNDELSKATPLPANGFREGFLSPKADVDYYVLRSEQPVLAKVQLSGVERLDLSLSLVRPGEKAEQVLMRVNDGAVKEPEIVNNVHCAGECWFKVEGALRKVDGKLVKDYENSELPYRLSVAVVPDDGGEEREPNGTAEAATPIALGRPIRGTVHPKKDSDYFRLDLSGRPVKTSLSASVTGILKVDVGLYLHQVSEDGKLTLVQTADRAKGDAPEIIRYTAEPGVYLFEVRDARNRESNFQDAYQLTVEEAD